jgi:hypothetical protein
MTTNIFTGRPAHAFFGTAEYVRNVMLTKDDPNFYAAFLLFTRPDDPFAPIEGIPDGEFQDNGYAMLENGDQDVYKDDILFLSRLNMVVKRGRTYYIHRGAKILYDPATGIFSQYREDLTPASLQALLAPFILFNINYVLPGRYWRAASVSGLSEAVGDATMLAREMKEIEAMWYLLKQKF